jgi:hypothetical protein
MAKYIYSADLYTWTPENGKQPAYTLTGEVQAEHCSAAHNQAYYDVLEQRIAVDANRTDRPYLGEIHLEQQS